MKTHFFTRLSLNIVKIDSHLLWIYKMKSYTQIHTNEGRRIAKRLFNHWKHKFEVEETPSAFLIPFPDAKVFLFPHETTLDVSIESDEDVDFSHLEHVVIDHLNRMAQQEFNVTWQHTTS